MIVASTQFDLDCRNLLRQIVLCFYFNQNELAWLYILITKKTNEFAGFPVKDWLPALAFVVKV